MVDILDQFQNLSTPAKVVVAVGVGVLLVGVFIVALLFVAVAGAFVLDLGETSEASVERSPAVAFDYEFDDTTNELVVTHRGGDSVASSAIWVETDDTAATWSVQTVTDGDATVVSDVTVGDTVRVIWASDNGDTSVLSRHTVQ